MEQRCRVADRRAVGCCLARRAAMWPIARRAGRVSIAGGYDHATAGHRVLGSMCPWLRWVCRGTLRGDW